MNRFISITLLALAGVTIVSCGKKQANEQGKGQRGKNQLAVDAVIVKPSPFSQQITVSGTIAANEEVELKAESTGKLTEISFKEGDFVKQGQLLAKINDSEIQARLQKLNLDVKLAADDEVRKKRLLEINAISQQEYDIALNKLEGIKSDINLTQAQIQKAEIRAPFNGKIGLRYVSPGAFVSSTTVLANLIQIDPIKIEFSIPERFSGMIKSGKAITFNLTNNLLDYQAKIYAFEPSIDYQTRSMKVRAVTSNKDGNLIPGSYVKVSLIFDELPNALLIPPQALSPELAGQKVYLVKKGKAAESMVKLGIRSGNSVEIVDGITEGDTLIISGLIQLKKGMPVKPNIVPLTIK
ncbi:MAG: efflux RND transporter periplasmic adaptor subunit [Bacteroidales bacterium]|nr:MAG: efflux RND transporter periplasmic adaptor subunit [Bacteroidales bacterium]